MRKALDREHAKTYRNPFGRWDITAPTYMAGSAPVMDHPAVAEAPLRTVSAALAADLRVAQGALAPRTSRVAPAARAAARERTQAFVAANARPKPQAPIATVQTAESKRERFARLDAMANALPEGCYALPRRAEAGAGQSMYFFKIYKTRRGNRIVMLTGGVGAFAQHTMSTNYQEVALTKIAADPKAAAVRFGHETGTCARCGSPLTEDKSRARGLGPVCVTKY